MVSHIKLLFLLFLSQTIYETIASSRSLNFPQQLEIIASSKFKFGDQDLTPKLITKFQIFHQDMNTPMMMYQMQLQHRMGIKLKMTKRIQMMMQRIQRTYNLWSRIE